MANAVQNFIMLSKVTDVANIFFFPNVLLNSCKYYSAWRQNYAVPKQICIDIHHLIPLSDTEDCQIGHLSKRELNSQGNLQSCLGLIEP